jgi:pimeloyl-ACP methyl ester carboxylesterase
MFTFNLRRLLTALLLATVLQAQAREYTATAPDGVTLAVQESGNPDGVPLIFIHGLLGSRLNWSEQLASPQLQGYRLITYDLRGHGLSAKPAGTQAYSDGRRWADDLHAVMQAANARKPVLVGWSLGGAVISNYLAAYGDQEIAAAVYVDGVIELTPGQITAHPDIYRDLISTDLRTHLDAINTFLRLCFQTPPPAPVLERLLANAAMASWDMQRGVQSMTVPADQGLRAASVPLLLLYGEHDALVRPEPSIARAVALNPRIQVKRYAQSGHAPFLEEAKRFNQDLAAFIAQLR